LFMPLPAGFEISSLAGPQNGMSSSGMSLGGGAT
jgi:hypothetical protein